MFNLDLSIQVDTLTQKQHRALPLDSAELLKQSKVPAIAKPEWFRIADATRFYGIGRSSLYELIGAGKIKSVVLCKKGNSRGIRLLSSASLDALLASLVEGGQE